MTVLTVVVRLVGVYESTPVEDRKPQSLKANEEIWIYCRRDSNVGKPL